MMIRCCIFDLDGVVVDTARFHFLAWAALARDLGFELPAGAAEATKGVSRMASLDIVLRAGGLAERFSSDEKERLAAEKNARYLDYVARMSPCDVLPGVREFLTELAQRGVRRALGSSSKNARAILDRCCLTDCFDAVVDGRMVGAAKPDPEVFLRGAGLLGVPPAECVVFEDAAAGIEAAARGGMRSVGVGGGETLGGAALRIASFEGFTFDKLCREIGNI